MALESSKQVWFTECNLQRHLTAQHSLSPIIPRHVTDFPLALVFVVVSDVREACLVRALECAGATFGMYTALTGVKLPGQATAVAEGNALGKVYHLYPSALQVTQDMASGQLATHHTTVNVT